MAVTETIQEKQSKPILLTFSSLDDDIALALPFLVRCRRQKNPVIIKQLLRQALRQAPDLPEEIKQRIA